MLFECLTVHLCMYESKVVCKLNLTQEMRSGKESTLSHTCTHTPCTLWFVALVREITESIVTLAAERRGGLEKTPRKRQRDWRGEWVLEGIYFRPLWPVHSQPDTFSECLPQKSQDFLPSSVTQGLRELHILNVYKKYWRFWLSSFIMKVQANRQKRSFHSSWPEGDYGSGNCTALLLWHWNVNGILGNVTSYKRTGYKIPLGRLRVWLSFLVIYFLSYMKVFNLKTEWMEQRLNKDDFSSVVM